MAEETILKICNAELELAEMTALKVEELASSIETVPFEKRYSLSYILSALDKCIKGEISLEYLRSWAELYVEIIDKSGFAERSLKEYFIDEIRTCVDSISVYEEDDEEFYTLEEYKGVFDAMDEMLSNADSLTVVYNEDYDENQGFTLAINEGKKEATLIYTDPDLDYDFKRITRAELISSISDFKAKGYNLVLLGMSSDFLTEISQGV